MIVCVSREIASRTANAGNARDSSQTFEHDLVVALCEARYLCIWGAVKLLVTSSDGRSAHVPGLYLESDDDAPILDVHKALSYWTWQVRGRRLDGFRPLCAD